MNDFSKFIFDIYVYGPYTSSLVRVYNDLAEVESDAIDALVSEFDYPRGADTVLSVLSRMNDNCLELMSIVYDIYLAHKMEVWTNLSVGFLVWRTKIVKPWVVREDVERAIRMLTRVSIISL